MEVLDFLFTTRPESLLLESDLLAGTREDQQGDIGSIFKESIDEGLGAIKGIWGNFVTKLLGATPQGQTPSKTTASAGVDDKSFVWVILATILIVWISAR